MPTLYHIEMCCKQWQLVYRAELNHILYISLVQQMFDRYKSVFCSLAPLSRYCTTVGQSQSFLHLVCKIRILYWERGNPGMQWIMSVHQKCMRNMVTVSLMQRLRRWNVCLPFSGILWLGFRDVPGMEMLLKPGNQSKWASRLYAGGLHVVYSDNSLDSIL